MRCALSGSVTNLWSCLHTVDDSLRCVWYLLYMADNMPVFHRSVLL